MTWLSKDGVYAWSGRGPIQWVSKDIRGTTKQLRVSDSSEQSWSVATQAGWEQGTGSGWDSVISPGIIKARTYNSGVLGSSVSYTRMYENSGFELGTSAGWTPAFPSVVAGGGVAWGSYNAVIDYGSTDPGFGAFIEVLNAADSVLISSTAFGTSCGNIGSNESLVNFTGITGSGNIKVRVTDSLGVSYLSDAFDRTNEVHSRRDCQHTAGLGGHYYEYFDFSELTAGRSMVSSTSTVYDAGLINPNYAANIQGKNITINFQYSDDSSTWLTENVGIGGTLSTSTHKRYFKYSVVYSSGVSISSFTSLTISALSSSTYSSPVYDFGAQISAWKNISMGNTDSEVNLSSIQVRSSATLFASTDTLPAWITQTNNATVSAAVARYGQYRILPNIATSTQSSSYSSSLVSWTLGSAAPRVASMSHNGRYLLCASITSTTQNDICLLWMKNKKWMPITGPSYGALSIYNNVPVAGDGTSGSKIWDILQDGINKYDDQAIDAFWVTKDYPLGQLNHHKVIERFWLTASSSPATNFTTAWQRDRDGVWYSSTTALNESPFVVKELDGLFLNETPRGRQFRFKFSNSDMDTWFRLKLFSIYYRVEELIK